QNMDLIFISDATRCHAIRLLGDLGIADSGATRDLWIAGISISSSSRDFGEAGISISGACNDLRDASLELFLATILLKSLTATLLFNDFLRPLTTFDASLPEAIGDLRVERAIALHLQLVDTAADLLGTKSVVPIG